ncbi:MAG: hypothetical protein ACYS47_18120 [Planctomycetota bacterium]|jgi:hypothetical protein
MSPPGNADLGELPDHTVDFASEILNTPSEELDERIRRLSPEMRATVLAEVARRFRELLARCSEAEEELTHLRYHAQRLEDLILRAREDR